MEAGCFIFIVFLMSVTVGVLWHFLTEPWVDMKCMIVGIFLIILAFYALEDTFCLM